MARSGTLSRTGCSRCVTSSARRSKRRRSRKARSSTTRSGTARRRSKPRMSVGNETSRPPRPSTAHATKVLLAVNNIEVIYDHVILVLKGVSLRVPERGIVALLGANGAGKWTTLKAISGLLRTERGDVTKGGIELAGEPIHRLAPDAVVRRGVVQVMEGRHVFEHLTVEENLLTGAYSRRNGGATKRDLDRVYT